MAERGIFITIEGPEGAGKTTQARLLYEHLRARYPVVYTREPGGTAIGERIRALLLDVSLTGTSPLTEMLLFAASRAQFVAEVVEPALREGRLLLSERYVDASIAYQGFGRGLDVGLVRRMNEGATRGVMPELTILLDIDPALGFQREGNSTILIGVDDQQIQQVLGVIQRSAHRREQFVSPMPPAVEPVDSYVTYPVKVEVGGAIVFVLQVERMERF